MDQDNDLAETIRFLESKRASLGDAVIDAALAPLLARQRSLGAPVEQRKVATVLFADVSGFTRMSELLDPEELATLMNAIWARVDEAIGTQNGRVDKHIGDAVMAVFGLYAAQPDDAVRAVRAAVGIQTAVAAASRDLQRAGRNAELKVRIGIHTGPVHAGLLPTTGEYTAMGDTVNVANRIEGAAPAGGILISHETWRHLRGAFQVRHCEPVRVKGKSELLRVYEVASERGPEAARPRWGVEGVVPPMLGREPEQDRLVAAYDRCVRERRAGRVLVVAEAGLGRSRLLSAFSERLERFPKAPQVLWAPMRSVTGRPMGLLWELLSAIRGVEAGASCEPDLVGLARAIERRLPGAGERLARDLGDVVTGAPDPREMQTTAGRDAADRRRRAFEAVLALLHGLTRTQPVVVIIDDVHLADSASLDLIEHVISADADLPLLVACAADPALDTERRGWSAHPRHESIPLRPLSAEQMTYLAGALLAGARGVPADLEGRLVAASAGSPYYLEEFVRSLVDDGVLLTESGWRFDETRVAALRIPTTLASVIQARLDALPDLERKVLRVASVFQPTASLDALRIIAEVDEAQLGAALETLVGAEMLTRAMDGERPAVAFLQSLMQSVVHETLLKDERRAWHAGAARWLESAAGGRLEATAHRIAEHWEAAEEIDRAVDRRLDAGRAAQRVYALEEATEHFGRVLNLLKGRLEPSLRRLQAMESMARVRFWQARTAAALEIVDAACVEARRLGDDGAVARALSERAMLQLMDGDAGAALAGAEEAVRAARASGLADLVARTSNDRGYALFKLGRLDEATTVLREALSMADQEDEATERFRALRGLMGIASKSGRVEEALTFGKQTLAVAEAESVPRWVGMVQNSLGEVHRTLGDYVAAERHYRAALARYEQLGIADSALLARSNLGGALVGQGRDDEAVEILDGVIRESPERWFALPETLHFLALARLHFDEVDLAYDLSIRSVELARGLRSPEDLGPGLRTLGEVVARKVEAGDGATVDEARACFSESAEILDAAGLEPARARTLRTWAGYEAAWGHPREAEALWSEARQIFNRIGYRLEEARMQSEAPLRAGG